MHWIPRSLSAPARRALIVLLPALLLACGGGGTAYTCDARGQKSWLQDFMGEWYFWYRLAPRPDPALASTLDDFFEASLYTGTDPAFPSDRWSYYETTESFNRFFGAGQSLGYGMSVAGIEVQGRPGDPLWVRYVEPLSDAHAKGVRRGDRVLALNATSASQLIAEDDFSLLTPGQAGDILSVTLDGPAGARTVVLSASVHALTPVNTASVVTTPRGRRMGYVVVKDMIDQARTPLDQAFNQFKAQGVGDIVLDLRYNGGGAVSVATTLGSYVNGARTGGRTFASLLYNDQRAPIDNQTFAFQNLSAALGLDRVYVLAGPRTCSASELIINGLRPFVDVVVIGDTSCGKPVGFLPKSNGCGDTFSVVNFESVNQDNEGRFFDGFEPSCRVPEDFSQALGSIDEPLLRMAVDHADLGFCPPLPAAARERPMRLRIPGARSTEPGERQGMIPR